MFVLADLRGAMGACVPSLLLIPFIFMDKLLVPKLLGLVLPLGNPESAIGMLWFHGMERSKRAEIIRLVKITEKTRIDGNNFPEGK